MKMVTQRRSSYTKTQNIHKNEI